VWGAGEPYGAQAQAIADEIYNYHQGFGTPGGAPAPLRRGEPRRSLVILHAIDYVTQLFEAHRLTPTQRRIAHCLVRKAAEAPFLSSVEVAELAGELSSLLFWRDLRELAQ